MAVIIIRCFPSLSHYRSNTPVSNCPYKEGVINTIVAEVQGVPGDDRCVLMLGYQEQMEDFIRNSHQKNIMLLTECSMGDNLRHKFPDRHFISTCHTCPHMKKITLTKVRDALVKEQFEIHLSDEIIEKARKSVERMIEIG